MLFEWAHIEGSKMRGKNGLVYFVGALMTKYKTLAQGLPDEASRLDQAHLLLPVCLHDSPLPLPEPSHEVPGAVHH